MTHLQMRPLLSLSRATGDLWFSVFQTKFMTPISDLLLRLGFILIFVVISVWINWRKLNCSNFSVSVWISSRSVRTDRSKSSKGYSFSFVSDERGLNKVCSRFESCFLIKQETWLGDRGHLKSFHLSLAGVQTRMQEVGSSNDFKWAKLRIHREIIIEKLSSLGKQGKWDESDEEHSVRRSRAVLQMYNCTL